MQKEHFTLSPMQNYNSPAYPSRESKPVATLGKLPVRWAKNASIIACIGALSLGVLAACAAEQTQPAAPCDDGLHGIIATYPQGDDGYIESGREFDVEVRAHWGGSGAGPFYVAYLTEQEALGIIRNRLCQAGICFDAPVPNYTATTETDWSAEMSAALSLFDERTRQGIVFPAPNWWNEFPFFDVSPEQIERALQQDFTRRFHISATFMQNPGESIGDYDWNLETEPIFTEKEIQEAGEILNEWLLFQIDTFLEHLRREGILPRN